MIESERVGRAAETETVIEFVSKSVPAVRRGLAQTFAIRPLHQTEKEPLSEAHERDEAWSRRNAATRVACGCWRSDAAYAERGREAGKRMAVHCLHDGRRQVRWMGGCCHVTSEI
eukprot:6199080-Pleurochrysis_carterae.AAC.2